MTEPRNRKYQVALSFAGEEREYVQKVASILKDRGVSVFYDEFEEEVLWGKNLYDYLREIYSNSADFTVIFVSKNYARKAWTNHERESAQVRALRESREYILPVRIDSTVLPGLSETTGHISATNRSPEDIAAIIMKKIEFARYETDEKLVLLAASLRNEFRAATRNLENLNPLDFSAVDAIIESLFRLDEINGHALYYSGETKRFLNREDWLSLGYRRSHEYFTTYLANAKRLTLQNSSSDYEQNAEECYRSTRGYCDSRTAWIFHLLANDYYALAHAQHTDLEKQELMVQAYHYATAAQRVFRNKVSVPPHFAATVRIIAEMSGIVGLRMSEHDRSDLYGF